MNNAFNIIWLRNDLRLHDNPAFQLANASGLPVSVVFIVPEFWLDAEASTPFSYREDYLNTQNQIRISKPKARFLRASLIDLQRQLYRQNIQLNMVYGDPLTLFKSWQQQGLQQVFTQQAQAPEESVWLDAISEQNITLTTYHNQALFDQQQLIDAGLTPEPQQWPASFSRFRRRIEKHIDFDHIKSAPPVALIVDDHPLSHHASIPWPTDFSGQDDSLPSLRFNLAGGEDNGLARLSSYIWQHQGLQNYKTTRNQLTGNNFSSFFSAYLAWGCLSAKRVIQEIHYFEHELQPNEHSQWLTLELLWREYFYWCLRIYGKRYFCYSGLGNSNAFKAAGFKPANFDQRWQAWQQAQTGVPMIDAGLKELIHTGYCSNRMRQNLASYFIHELQLDWRLGAQFFEQHLIDFDVAVNWGNWAYLAGVGNDPQHSPNADQQTLGRQAKGRWFSINKQLQQYDPQLQHIHQWLPQLNTQDLAQIQAHSSGQQPLAHYPLPIVPVTVFPGIGTSSR
ncbi:DASH family cryptochrome [Bacterioplanoides sp.]|uniref:DASH family cryptochrome n=1 Tax=Bacterioplanoides sp. TaxID=2066072 RepID=UPI003AFF6F1F